MFRSDIIAAFFAKEIDKYSFVALMQRDGAPPQQISDVIEEAESEVDALR